MTAPTLPTLRDRTAGVLLHATSLPGPHGSGDLGPAAHAFVETLARAGARWWQMLPVHPPSGGPSPYQASSTFAGSPQLVSLEALGAWGLLTEADLAPPSSASALRIDWGTTHAFREDRLRRASTHFFESSPASLRPGFEAFCREHAWWLDDFALFDALKHAHAHGSWTDWPAPLATRDRAALEAAKTTHRAAIDHARFVQFAFYAQWEALRARCRELGVGLLGDIPIFVGHDSADVWANRSLFELGADGRPTVVAGVPPDLFSETGQRWGNPLYRWDAMRAQGYGWWLARVAHVTRLFDAVRLDHFIGFTRHWEIPASEPTAVVGRFVPGPGRELFDAITRDRGGSPPPLIAEDLGVLTDEVRALRDGLGFPGMRILQFSFGTSRSEHPFTIPKRSVVYTGTHDNDTSRGWFEDATALRDPSQRAERELALRYCASDGREPWWDLIRLALMSPADTAIVPAQDVLGLGGEARMNLPATDDGNWSWRLPPGGIPDAALTRLRALIETYGRSAV